MSAIAAAKPGQVTGTTKQSNPPNQTLYISNLNDRIPKDDLRRALYGAFSTFGPVLDIVALKTMKMRGQAHVAFRDVQTSTQAMRALQGLDFFGKEMRIAYGRGKSNMISRLDGTVKAPEANGIAAKPVEPVKSIFAAPPVSGGAPGTSAVPGTGLPAPPTLPPPTGLPGASQGTKRPREDEEEEGGDAPMEEDEDDGGAMDMDESDEE